MSRTTFRRARLVLAAAVLLGQLACTDGPTRPEAGLLTGAGGPLASKAPAQRSPPLLVWTPGHPDDGFDFEGVLAGEKTTREFTLTNAGGSASGALTIGWAGAASFRVTRDDCGRASLPPGRSCTMSVEFEPQVIGHEQSALVASGQRREAHARLALHGVGLEPRLQSDAFPHVYGNGTPLHPYSIDCPVSADRCTPIFPWRELAGLTSEMIPAYECPGPWLYLKNQVYVPFGTSVPNGVEIDGLGWIGAFVRYPLVGRLIGSASHLWAVGTHPRSSSMTNWNTAPRSYRVGLHCTKSQSEGYEPPPADRWLEFW